MVAEVDSLGHVECSVGLVWEMTAWMARQVSASYFING